MTITIITIVNDAYDEALMQCSHPMVIYGTEVKRNHPTICEPVKNATPLDLLREVSEKNPFTTNKFAFINANALSIYNISMEEVETLLANDISATHVIVKEVIIPYKEVFNDDLIITNGNCNELRISYGESIRNIFRVTDYDYVIERCMRRYVDLRRYNQAKRCCDAILSSGVTGANRFRTLYYLYMAHYWLNEGDKVMATLNDMAELIRIDNEAHTNYKDNKEFYDTNIAYASVHGKIPSMIRNTLCVAIPCYKPHLGCINTLLDSIRAQTRKPDEVIIVSSQTQVVDAIDVKLEDGWSLCIKASQANASTNRNALAAMSNCDIISFIDADDVMYPDRCELIMKAFEEDPDVSLVLHNFNFLGENDRSFEPCGELRFIHGYLFPGGNHKVHNGHVSVRRSLFTHFKYNESLMAGEDVDFTNRIYNASYKVKYLPNKLSIYSKIKNKTIYGMLVGGMGNQLFIMAKTLYEAKRTGANYAFVITNHNPYLDTLYSKIKDKFIDRSQLRGYIVYKEKQWSYYDTSFDIDTCFCIHDNVLLEGYWQSERHFPGIREQLLNMLDLQCDYNVDDACLIMVRRGDYLKYKDIHNPCNLTYYKEAMKIMRNKGIKTFYITSDDMEYCKEHFQEAIPIDGDDVNTLKQAVKFKHFIIANSTYHWFATFFADGVQTIIAPDEWIKLPNTDYRSIYRHDMIIIPRNDE